MSEKPTKRYACSYYHDGSMWSVMIDACTSTISSCP